MGANEIASLLAERAEHVCHHLLPSGRRKGAEWCVGSVAGEAGNSLKVRLTGAKAGMWADFATGEKGDLVGLWQRVRNVDLPTACRDALGWLGIHGTDTVTRGFSGVDRRPPSPSLRSTKLATRVGPRPMPAEVVAQWSDGIDYLVSQPGLCEKIDVWRGWPRGTSRILLDSDMLGCPQVDGQRTTAFCIQSPYRDEIGSVSTCGVGFHARFRPRAGERAPWRYVPKGVGSFPFVLGDGCIESARCLVVLEGPWDAVMFAACAGWLAHETAWPEYVVVFGIRGATAWRSLIDTWLPFVTADAGLLLVQDADNAGDVWRTTFVPALSSSGFRVRLLRPKGAKDFSDLARTFAINPEELL